MFVLDHDIPRGNVHQPIRCDPIQTRYDFVTQAHQQTHASANAHKFPFGVLFNLPHLYYLVPVKQYHFVQLLLAMQTVL